MSEERKKILQMLADGKISPEDAERLLDAIGSEKKKEARLHTSAVTDEDDEEKPKYFRVVVESKKAGGENVNIKIPLNIIRAGAKVGSMLPPEIKKKLEEKMRSKGMPINEGCCSLNGGMMEGFLHSMTSSQIEIDEDDEKIRIFTE